MASRQNEHKSDKTQFKDKHKEVQRSTEGGACLTGHVSGRDSQGFVTEVSCNYRWQAYKQALVQCSLYNSPAYESLSSNSKKILMRLRFGFRWTSPPKEGEWDVSKRRDSKNFRSSCNVPYWHEAHHIVPHGELRDAINDVGTGTEAAIYREVIREGLLDEKYNLNHKSNMIILPMDKKIARTIDLPRHRRTPNHWSHRAYSDHVRTQLDDIFKSIRQEESAHKKRPEYKACKSRIVAKSNTLRNDIIAAGGQGSLDEAFATPPKSEL